MRRWAEAPTSESAHGQEGTQKQPAPVSLLDELVRSGAQMMLVGSSDRGSTAWTTTADQAGPAKTQRTKIILTAN